MSTPEYRKANKEKIKESDARYKKANKEKIRKQKLDWWHKNKEQQKLRLNHPDLKKLRKEQMRKSHLKRNFGLSLEDYDKLCEEQKGVCAICKKAENKIDWRTKSPLKLSVDHDHKTGKVRQLVCNRCNGLLSRCEEDVSLLDEVKSYLIRHKGYYAEK